MSNAQTSPAPVASEETRFVAIAAYILFLLAFMNGITAIVGVVLAYVKRGDARGTIYASHYSNLITTFWVTLVLGLILCALVVQAVFGTILFLAHPIVFEWHPWLYGFFPGVALGFVALAVFYLYRTVKGLVRVLEGVAY